MKLTIHFDYIRKIGPKTFLGIILTIESEDISDLCFRTCCMTLVQKLGILCLPKYESVKTGCGSVST